MNEEVTNQTPLVTPAQHQTLLDAADVFHHLATQAANDEKAGRAPEGTADDMALMAHKLNGTAMLLELAGMVSQE